MRYGFVEYGLFAAVKVLMKACIVNSGAAFLNDVPVIFFH
jgi:hypothetical protein